jgi:hypothetical protein
MAAIPQLAKRCQRFVVCKEKISVRTLISGNDLI